MKKDPAAARLRELMQTLVRLVASHGVAGLQEASLVTTLVQGHQLCAAEARAIIGSLVDAGALRRDGARLVAAGRPRERHVGARPLHQR